MLATLSFLHRNGLCVTAWRAWGCGRNRQIPCIHASSRPTPTFLNSLTRPATLPPALLTQNMENVVNDNDNIKQDMSIDVYGRKKADDYAAKQVRVRWGAGRSRACRLTAWYITTCTEGICVVPSHTLTHVHVCGLVARSQAADSAAKAAESAVEDKKRREEEDLDMLLLA